MNNLAPLVSIVIPGRNSGRYLEHCFQHIKKQTYKNIEIIVVDSNSTDNTEDVCKKYTIKVIQFKKKHFKNKFDATHKRNVGIKHTKGEFVYYLDADMYLTPHVIGEAVAACTKEKYDAVIVKEVVRGVGFWARVKHMEQETYWGDDNVEAPRFFRTNIWKKLNGLDQNLGAGCDDWDLYQRFLKAGYKAKRIKAHLNHHEGHIKLNHLFKKGIMYGRDVSKFVKKSPRGGFTYFFPLRKTYLKNWRLLAKHPDLTLGLIFMRTVEYSAGAIGILANALQQSSNE